MVKSLQKMLETKRQELTNKVSLRDGIVIERSSDTLDEVQRAAERDWAISSLDRDWQTLKAIDSALDRINEGTYGICLRCDDDISPKRLMAIPWASYCISCQEQVDQENRRGAVGLRMDISDAA